MKKINYSFDGSFIKSTNGVGVLILVLGVIGSIILLVMGIAELSSYSADELRGGALINQGIYTLFTAIVVRVVLGALSNINKNLHILRTIEENKLAESGVVIEGVGEEINYKKIAAGRGAKE